MSNNTVTVVLDLADGSGKMIAEGACQLTPTAVLTDAVNNLYVPGAPVWAAFNGLSYPSALLLATDNAAPQPSGWAWTANFTGVPGSPPSFSFFVPAAPQTFTATDASPCVFTGSGSGYPDGTGVQLSGGSLPAGFTAGTTYFAVNASGSTFQLAATAGGSPLASTGTGSGPALAVQYYLSSLSPVSSVTTMAGYMPLPGGTPAAGWIPVATGAGEASAWGTPGGDLDGGSALGGEFPAGVIDGGDA